VSSALLILIFCALSSVYVLGYKYSKFYYTEGYSVYFSVCCLAVIVMYVQCGYLCPVLLSVLSVIILEKVW